MVRNARTNLRAHANSRDPSLFHVCHLLFAIPYLCPLINVRCLLSPSAVQCSLSTYFLFAIRRSLFDFPTPIILIARCFLVEAGSANEWMHCTSAFYYHFKFRYSTRYMIHDTWCLTLLLYCYIAMYKHSKEIQRTVIITSFSCVFFFRWKCIGENMKNNKRKWIFQSP